jgi:hypothetical protein
LSPSSFYARVMRWSEALLGKLAARCADEIKRIFGETPEPHPFMSLTLELHTFNCTY